MSSFPDVRLRRFRRTGALRGLVRETHLSLEQFVMPLDRANTRTGPRSMITRCVPSARPFSLSSVTAVSSE